MLKIKSFNCTTEIWDRLQTIAKKRKASGENCSVSELLRKGAIHIIKINKEVRNVRF